MHSLKDNEQKCRLGRKSAVAHIQLLEATSSSIVIRRLPRFGSVSYSCFVTHAFRALHIS